MRSSRGLNHEAVFKKLADDLHLLAPESFWQRLRFAFDDVAHNEAFF